MIQGNLVMALDFDKDGKTRRRQYSYRAEGHWYVVNAGDGYSNTFKVTEYDGQGLAQLLAIEREKDGTALPDREDVS